MRSTKFILSSAWGGASRPPSQAPIPLRGACRSPPCSAFWHEQGTQHNHPDPQWARVAGALRGVVCRDSTGLVGVMVLTLSFFIILILRCSPTTLNSLKESFLAVGSWQWQWNERATSRRGPTKHETPPHIPHSPTIRKLRKLTQHRTNTNKPMKQIRTNEQIRRAMRRSLETTHWQKQNSLNFSHTLHIDR